MVESSLVYKKIIDGASFGYARCRILYDAEGVPVDGVYLEVNAAFAHAVRRSSREIVGRSISELVSESGFQLNDMLEMMDRAIKTGEAQEFESHS